MLMVHQRYRQTDGRMTFDSNTALALHASRGKNWQENENCQHKLYFRYMLLM